MISIKDIRCSRGRDRMVVGRVITYASSGYHQ